MARILLVEDDPALSRGIIALLKGAGHAADCAKDGETALFLIDSEPCSLVILDIGLPGISGLEVIKRLRTRGCRTPVLVLTARDHVTDRVKGLDLGADDYLLKPFNASELGARVRALLRRDHGDPSPVVVIGNLTIDRTHATAEVNGRPLQLRRREWAVLDRLIAKAGEVASQEARAGRADDPHHAGTGIHAHGALNARDVQVFNHEIPDCLVGHADGRS